MNIGNIVMGICHILIIGICVNGCIRLADVDAVACYEMVKAVWNPTDVRRAREARRENWSLKDNHTWLAAENKRLSEEGDSLVAECTRLEIDLDRKIKETVVHFAPQVHKNLQALMTIQTNCGEAVQRWEAWLTGQGQIPRENETYRYLVGEHTRLVTTIQDFEREVEMVYREYIETWHMDSVIQTNMTQLTQATLDAVNDYKKLDEVFQKTSK